MNLNLNFLSLITTNIPTYKITSSSLEKYQIATPSTKAKDKQVLVQKVCRSLSSSPDSSTPLAAISPISRYTFTKQLPFRFKDVSKLDKITPAHKIVPAPTRRKS